MKKALTLSLGMCLVLTQAFSFIWYVKPNGTGFGISWSQASGDLQTIISISNPGDTIWIAGGTYTPAASDRDVSFRFKEDAKVFGGFDGTEVSLEDRDLLNNETILSGNIGDLSSQTDNSRSVVKPLGNIYLYDLTVSDGYAATPVGSANGVGMFLEPTTDVVVIDRCTFKNNTGEDGAGIYISSGSNTVDFTVSNSLFRKNFGILNGTTRNGGALHLRTSSLESTLIMTNTRLDSNDASFLGGALYTTFSTTIQECEVIDNSAFGYGGIYTTSPVSSTVRAKMHLVENCSFEGNDNGSLVVGSDSNLVLNCNFNSNFSAENGGRSYATMFIGGKYCLVDSCQFLDNRTGFGCVSITGRSNAAADLFVTNCLFKGNTLARNRTGLITSRTTSTATSNLWDLTVDHCTIDSNIATSTSTTNFVRSPVIDMEAPFATLKFSNSEVKNNYAFNGPTIGLVKMAEFDVYNVTFYNNFGRSNPTTPTNTTASSFRNCSFVRNTSSLTTSPLFTNDEIEFVNNLFLENTDANGTNDIGFTPGPSFQNNYGFEFGSSNGNIESGNITVQLADIENGDLRPTFGAPVVDAGNGDRAPEFDLDGNPRNDFPFSPNVGTGTPNFTDIGAYEFEFNICDDAAITSSPADENRCLGQSLSLTVSATGTNLSYQWKKDDEEISGATSATYTVNEVTAADEGFYTCVVVGDCGAAQISEGAEVIIDALPDFSIESSDPDNSICLGSEVTLSGTGTGNLVFEWDKGVEDGVAFTPLQTTTYQLTTTDDNGCMDSSEVTITVNNNPDANAGDDMEVCQGEAAQLSASGGVNYFWNPTTGLSSNTIADPEATPDATTTYSLFVTDANGCTDFDVVTISVNERPEVGILVSPDSEILAGNEVTLSGTGALSYEWNQGVVDGAPFIAELATYTVTGTDANGCEGQASVTVSVVTGTNEVIASDLQFYPNPVGDELIIQNVDAGTIAIYNLRSELLLKITVDGGAIPVEHLPAGTYLLKWSQEAHTLTSLFFKK